MPRKLWELRKSFKKEVTVSDLPFKKLILGAKWTVAGSGHSQVRWWQRLTAGMEKSQRTDKRNKEGKSTRLGHRLGGLWSYRSGRGWQVSGWWDQRRRQGAGGRCWCWFSFEAQLWASSTGIRYHPVRKYPTAVWSKRIFHDNGNLYLSCPKWQPLATCSYWALGSCD